MLVWNQVRVKGVSAMLTTAFGVDKYNRISNHSMLAVIDARTHQLRRESGVPTLGLYEISFIHACLDRSVELIIESCARRDVLVVRKDVLLEVGATVLDKDSVQVRPSVRAQWTVNRTEAF